MNDHLREMANRDHVQVLHEGGPLHGTMLDREHPGLHFEVAEPDHPNCDGEYGLSHRLPGDVLVYFYVRKAS